MRALALAALVVGCGSGGAYDGTYLGDLAWSGGARHGCARVSGGALRLWPQLDDPADPTGANAWQTQVIPVREDGDTIVLDDTIRGGGITATVAPLAVIDEHGNMRGAASVVDASGTHAGALHLNRWLAFGGTPAELCPE